MNLKRELIVLGTAFLTIGLLISCQSTPQLATSSPSGIGVGISDDLCPNVIVEVGQQITWTNQGAREHIVRDITVEGKSQFDSGSLQSGDTFAFTFSEPQTYKYQCSADGSLKGTITVSDPPAPSPIDSSNYPICFDTFLAPIAFMPEGEKILVRAESGVQIFDLEKRAEELFIESPTKLNGPAVALSPDGEKLAWALEDNSIQLIRLTDQEVICTTNVHAGPVTKLRFSPDGLSLFSASHDGWVKEINNDGEVVNEFQPGGGEIFGIGISPDGKTIATVPFDGPVKLWDRTNNQLVAEMEGTGGFDTSDVAFSSNGQYLAADLATGLAVWDIAEQSLLWDGVNSMAFAFSPVENILAYADIGENNDLILSSPDGTQSLNKLSGHQGPVWELNFSPDGQLLASTDGIDLRIWRVESGELLYIGKSECP